MKKIKILLISVLVLGLVGCSSNESKGLTVWVEKVFSEDANNAVAERIEQFSTEKNIEVSYEFIAATDFMTKLNAAIESGSNVPDIISASSTKVLNYFPNIPQSDVTNLVKEINNERPFIDAIFQGSTIDEKQYFVPFTSSNMLMFLRKDKLEENGITEVPTTWNEVFEVAEKISDSNNGFYGLGIGSGPTDEDGENIFRIMMWNEGAYMFDEQGNITINSDKTKDLLQKYKDAYDNKVIPASAHTWDPGSNNGSYLTGESGIVYNAATLYNALNSEENKELFDNTIVVNLPRGTEEDTTMGFISGFSIMEASSMKNEAEELIKYLMDRDWYDSYVESIAPVFAPVFGDSKEISFWQDGVNKQVLDYANNSYGYYGYPTLGVKERAVASRHYFSFPIAEMMNNVVTGRMTPEESVKNAEEKIKEVGSEINE